MKKVILLIAVLAATTLTMFAYTSQAGNNPMMNTEVMNEEYVQVDFKDLSVEARELLLKVFVGYEFVAIYQQFETKLLKVVVVKEEVEQTFIQNEEGKFIEQ